MNRTKSTLGLILAGLIFLAVGFFSTRMALDEKKRCTETIMAVVTDVKESTKIVTTNKKNSTTGQRTKKTKKEKEYQAVISYDFNGVTYTNDMDYSSSVKSLAKGDKVEIHIDPNSPNDFYSEKSHALLISILITGAGVVVLGSGIFKAIKG